MIRDAARQAWLTSREGIARSTLAEVVGDLAFDEVNVTVASTDPWVFTDGEIHLAVTSGEVHLVEDDAGWTDRGAVSSLVELYELLPAPAPEPDPDVKVKGAWTAGIDVKVGEVYSYAGSNWQVVQAHRTQADWTPDVTPALWVAV